MFEESDLTVRQRELVSAALRLLDRDGINRFTMRALADEIGLSPMAAYKHFENQRELQLQMWRACISDLRAFLQGCLETSPAAAIDRYVTLVGSFINYSLEHPYRFELLFNHPFIREVWRETDIDRLREAVWAVAAGIIGEGQAEGTIRRELNMDDLTGQTYALAHGACYLLGSGRLQRQTGKTAEELRDQTLSYIREMLEPR